MCNKKSDRCRFCQSDSETSLCEMSLCGGVMERSRKLDTVQLGETNKIFTHRCNPRILTQGQSVYSNQHLN